MTIYTVFFVRPDRAIPDFKLGEFPTLRAAMVGAAEMAKAHRGPCRAEIYDQNRQVAVVPLNAHPCEMAPESPPSASVICAIPALTPANDLQGRSS